jgi:site-specific DNA recombinase
MRIVGYVRVSRVAGRDGDSFQSPEEQRERIEHFARSGSVQHELVDWQTDLDESGGKYERPGFQAALEAVEQGRADGIAVARLNRFARSVFDAQKALRRLEDAGGAFLAADLGMDTSTDHGQLIRNVLFSVAEFELAQTRASSAVIRERTIERGVHICRVPPVGYLRGDDGRLELDPDAAPVIREVFRRRAAGESWTSLCEFLDERLPRAEGSWPRQTVTSLVAGRVYLGEASSGPFVNRQAHPPLVSLAEWEAAQATAKSPAVRAGGSLLAGLIRCGGCGSTLTRLSDGSRGYANYRCRGRSAGGVCPEPTGISVSKADKFVTSAYLEWVAAEGIRAHGRQVDAELSNAAAQLEAAQAELAAYAKTILARVNPEAFDAGVLERQRVIDETAAEVARLRRTASPALELRDVPGLWHELELPERRRLLAAAIDCVVCRRAPVPGKGTPTVDRLMILWAGEAPDGLPGRNANGPVRLGELVEFPNTAGIALAQERK